MFDWLHHEACKMHCLKIANEIRSMNCLYAEIDSPFSPTDMPLTDDDILRVKASHKSFEFSLHGPIPLVEVYENIIDKFLRDPKISIRVKHVIWNIYQSVAGQCTDQSSKESQL